MPMYGELALALMGVWVCQVQEVTLGLGLNWEGSPVLPPVLVLIVRDRVEYKALLSPLERVPLDWHWDRLH